MTSTGEAATNGTLVRRGQYGINVSVWLQKSSSLSAFFFFRLDVFFFLPSTSMLSASLLSGASATFETISLRKSKRSVLVIACLRWMEPTRFELRDFASAAAFVTREIMKSSRAFAGGALASTGAGKHGVGEGKGGDTYKQQRV